MAVWRLMAHHDPANQENAINRFRATSKVAIGWGRLAISSAFIPRRRLGTASAKSTVPPFRMPTLAGRACGASAIRCKSGTWLS